MTLSKYQVPPFVDGNALPAAVINHSETEIVKAVDGTGGDYTALTPIRIGGLGIQDVCADVFQFTAATSAVYTWTIPSTSKHRLYIRGIIDNYVLAGSTLTIVLDADVQFTERDIYFDGVPGRLQIIIQQTGVGTIFTRTYGRPRADVHLHLCRVDALGHFLVQQENFGSDAIENYEPAPRIVRILTEPVVVGVFERTSPAYLVSDAREIIFENDIVSTANIGSATALFNIVLMEGEAGRRVEVVFSKGLGSVLLQFKTSAGITSFTATTANALTTIHSVNNVIGGLTRVPVTYTFVQKTKPAFGGPAEWELVDVKRVRPFPTRVDFLFATVIVSNNISTYAFYLPTGNASFIRLDTWSLTTGTTGSAICELRIPEDYPHDEITFFVEHFDRVEATDTVNGPVVKLIDAATSTLLTSQRVTPLRHVQLAYSSAFRMGWGEAMTATFKRVNDEWEAVGIAM